jgi:hypothetical protein
VPASTANARTPAFGRVVHLLLVVVAEELGQRSTRPEELGLDGPFGDAEHARDLAHIHREVVAEHRHFALPPRETRKRLLDFGARISLEMFRGRSEAIGGSRFGAESPPATPRQVQRDPGHPCRERPDLLRSRSFPGSRERFLHGIFGSVSASRDEGYGRDQSRITRLEELPDRLVVQGYRPPRPDDARSVSCVDTTEG